MKKIFIFALVASALMSSCSNDEQVYSCNQSIDEWVHDNLTSIRQMTRSEWSTIDENLKIPVYRAFTAQQRMDFWQERFADILTLDWSNEEREHIALLAKEIKENPAFVSSYNEMSDGEKNAFDLFMYQWQEKAINELHWDFQLLKAVVASGNTLLDTKGTLALSNNRTTTFSSAESNCDCNLTSDWCTPQGWNCEDTNCDETPLGCGTLLLHSCNGECLPDL